MDAEEKIFNLMLIAEEQQKTINLALAEIPSLLGSMGSYSDRITANNNFLLETLNSMRGSAAEVNKTFAGSLPRFQKLIAQEMEETLREVYSNSSATAAKALTKEFEPIGRNIKETISAAETAKSNLVSASRRLVISSILVTFIAVACIAGLGGFALWWTKTEYDKLANQYNTLASDGAHIKLSKCGSSSRLCVEILSDQQTIYKSDDNAHFYIVPKGY